MDQQQQQAEESAAFVPFDSAPSAEHMTPENVDLEMRAWYDLFAPLWAKVPDSAIVIASDVPKFRRVATIAPESFDSFKAAVEKIQLTSAKAGKAANIYFSTQPMSASGMAELAPTERGSKEQVAAIVCFFADLDTADGVHKVKPGQRLPDRSEVLAMIAISPLGEPSLLVDSAGGYHAYWMLDRPLQLNDQTRDLMRRWSAWIASYASEAGFTVDAGLSADPARVLRIPGTFNEKVDPFGNAIHRPVWINSYNPDAAITIDGPDSIDHRLAPLEPKPKGAPAKWEGESDPLGFNRNRATLEYILESAGCRRVDADDWVRPGSRSTVGSGHVYEDDDAVRIQIFGSSWQSHWDLEPAAGDSTVSLRAVDVVATRWLGGDTALAHRIVEGCAGDARIVTETVSNEDTSLEDLAARFPKRRPPTKVSPETPLTEAETQSLTERAATIVAAGMHLVPTVGRKPGASSGDVHADSEQVQHAVGAGETTCLGLRLGSSTDALDDKGDHHWTLALDFEGDGNDQPRAARTFADALSRAGYPTLASRLRTGWSERTSSGGERWYVQLAAADEAAWPVVEDLLIGPHREIRQAGTVVATIRTGGYTIVAPSQDGRDTWTTIAGGPSTIPSLCLAEVLTLGRVMRRLSSGGVQRGTDVTYEPRTRLLADAYDRDVGSSVGANDRLAAQLIALGWLETANTDDGARTFTREGVSVLIGGRWSLPGRLTSYDADAGPLYGCPSPFSTGLVLANEERTLRGYAPLTPAAWAEMLMESGTMLVSATPTLPADRHILDLASTFTDEAIRTVSSAILSAQHPNGSLPLWIRIDPSGSGRGAYLACLEMTGRLATRTIRDASTVAMSVCQPVQVMTGKNGNEVTKIQHSFPYEIARPAVEHVLGSDTTYTIRRIATLPFVAPDGQIVTTPGVHETSRTLLVIPEKERGLWAERYNPPIGEVTGEQAQEAVDFLVNELLCDFQFATSGDRARAVAYLLSVTAGPLVSSRPIFLFDAANRGTGKGLLAGIGRVIATGKPEAQSVGYGRRTDEETRKQAVGAFLSGQHFLHVDELPRGHKIDSLVLTELSTAEDGQVAYRLLGGNDVIALSGMMISVCGNNIEVGGDMTRRVVSIRMEHQGEGLPQARTGFKHPLPRWALENRAEILAACHTLIAHGIQHSTGKEWSGLGGFEGWKRTVLGALQHVTIDGGAADNLMMNGRDEWEEEMDDDADEWQAFMEAWSEKIPGQEYRSAKELLEKLGQGPHHVPSDLIPLSGMPTQKLWSRKLAGRRKTLVRIPAGMAFIDMKASRSRGNGFRLVIKPDTATVSD